MSRYGTFTKLRPAVFAKKSNANSVMPGTAAELNFPGSAFARFTKSARLAKFIAVGAPTARMVEEKRAIGTMSSGLYDSLSYRYGWTVKLPAGLHRKVWSSLADSTVWIAIMLS